MDSDALPETQVRKRQQSCFVNNLSLDEQSEIDPPYNPGKRISLAQVINLDKHDNSLEQYKKAVLGDITELKEEPPEVEFLLMEMVFPDHQNKFQVIDIQAGGLQANKQSPFKIKEGEKYQLRLHFIVRNDCVLCLKFYNIITRHSIKVDSYSELLGSFAPKKQVHIANLSVQEAPSGFLYRGHYKGKVMFVDRDGIVHFQFEYFFEISKEW